MATKTQKKKAKIDTEQICALIKRYSTPNGHYMVRKLEKDLLDAVCKDYTHPRYQRKPTPNSLRACVRREYRKTLLVAKPLEEQSRSKSYYDPRIKGNKAWEQRGFNKKEYDYHSPFADYNPKPSKTPQPVTLKAVTRLTEKTDNQLAKSVLRLKALNEEKVCLET